MSIFGKRRRQKKTGGGSIGLLHRYEEVQYGVQPAFMLDEAEWKLSLDQLMRVIRKN